jgi:hypothetical protein
VKSGARRPGPSLPTPQSDRPSGACPTIAGSPPKRRFHGLWLSTVTAGGSVRFSSSGRKKRPRAGRILGGRSRRWKRNRLRPVRRGRACPVSRCNGPAEQIRSGLQNQRGTLRRRARSGTRRSGSRTVRSSPGTASRPRIPGRAAPGPAGSRRLARPRAQAADDIEEAKTHVHTSPCRAGSVGSGHRGE